ncbi:MAG TPA: hypothetical protein VNR18_08810 [Hyphomicrobiales bacterium]|nr:hypothetical protein [Hyphomicrobiales bacterium]
MKHTTVTLALVGSLLMGLHAPTALGQLRVERVDADTLRVSEFQGSPPHRRQYISQQAHPQLYDRYESYLQAKPEPQSTAARHGAPGKNHVRSRVSTERAAEAAAVPREVKNGRLWFGAPGKGRRSGL